MSTSEARLPDDPELRLLFVCSGNICRSPMAEGMADDLAMAAGHRVIARSAGTLGIQDRPAEPRAVKACREIGVDLRRHRSQGLTPELLAWADYVLVMEEHHAVTARDLDPALPEDRVVSLGPLAGKAAIDDPIGAWFTGPYRTARDDIRAAMTRFFAGRLSPRGRP